MRASGRMTRPVGRGNSSTSTEMFMMESGKTIRLRATESTSTPTARGTKGSGKMTSSMGSGKRPGKMGLFIKGNSNMERNTEKAKSSFQMEVTTRENSRTTTSMVSASIIYRKGMELTIGAMGKPTLVGGKTTRCMAKGR